jgi:hypothetical protein
MMCRVKAAVWTDIYVIAENNLCRIHEMAPAVDIAVIAKFYIKPEAAFHTGFHIKIFPYPAEQLPDHRHTFFKKGRPELIKFPAKIQAAAMVILSSLKHGIIQFTCQTFFPAHHITSLLCVNSSLSQTNGRPYHGLPSDPLVRPFYN